MMYAVTFRDRVIQRNQIEKFETPEEATRRAQLLARASWATDVRVVRQTARHGQIEGETITEYPDNPTAGSEVER